MNSNALSYSEEEEKRATRDKVSKPMLWLGMVSMMMLFAGLSSAYVVSHSSSKWLKFELPQLFYVSTAIIIHHHAAAGVMRGGDDRHRIFG